MHVCFYCANFFPHVLFLGNGDFFLLVLSYCQIGGNRVLYNMWIVGLGNGIMYLFIIAFEFESMWDVYYYCCWIEGVVVTSFGSCEVI